VPIYKEAIKLTVVIIKEYHCYQIHIKYASLPLFCISVLECIIRKVHENKARLESNETQ
jgi:hypothetical protein